MSESLHIQLLGGFRFLQGAAQIRGLEHASLRNLLTYLLLHRNLPVSRQQLAFALWPDSTEGQALANLRTQLVRLRRAWPQLDHYLETSGRTLQWRADAPLHLDVAEFEAALQRAAVVTAGDAVRVAAELDAALHLYSGDLLPSSYEEWVVPERERLRQLYLQALRRLMQHETKQGDYIGAIDRAQQLLYQDPLEESLYQQLMQLHAQRGDRAGVMRVYETCRAVLQKELAVAPSAATMGLYQTLVRQAAATTLASPAAAPPRHNLPYLLTSFIGRERELAELQPRLAATRLLTLTGPGGCGKTRLALQLAHESAGAFPDGVWWVDLASVADGRTVPSAVAAALAVSSQNQPAPLEALKVHLRAVRLLLVLDNCEHLVPACAALIEHLLPACPGLTLLATTQTLLGVAGESVWPVPGLALPTGEAAEAVDQSEGVRLFVERARLAWPTFSLSDRDRPAVAQLVRRLDGLPLAIELAAARVRLLSPAQIVARLDQRLDLLRTTSSAAPPRHQTLRALVDWSVGMLAPPERALLARLSVFTGGFTMEAAEAVCGDSGPAVLDGLAHLVDRSLVFVESTTGADTRYRLLETIRQYAQELLREAGETERWRQRHLNYYLARADEAEPRLFGADQPDWLERLDTDLDDIRAALDWALSSGQSEASMRLAGDLWFFWHVRGYGAEGLALLRRALADGHAVAPLVRARALYRAGYVAPWEANAEARALLTQGLALCRDLGDRLGLGLSLTLLGWRILFDEREAPSVQVLLEEGRTLLREQGHPWGLCLNLFVSALMALYQRDFDNTRRFAEESLALARAAENLWDLANGLHMLAELARTTGDYARAEVLYEEVGTVAHKLRFSKHSQAAHQAALGYSVLRQAKVSRAKTLFRESLMLADQAQSWTDIGMALAGLGGVAASRGDALRAARLLGASQAFLEARGVALEPQDQAELDLDLVAVRRGLGEAAFASAWTAGRALPLEQAIEYALAPSGQP